MYATTSTKSEKLLNTNIEDLLQSRKKILDLARKDVVIDNDYPRKDIESSITLTPGKLLSTAKTTMRTPSILSQLCLFNDNRNRKRVLRVEQNEGDNNEDIDVSGMVLEFAHKPFKRPSDDLVFEQSFRSFSTIKEGIKESYSDEEEFKTAKSNENNESLLIRLEGMDLVEENTELKQENKRLKEQHQQEVLKLREELAKVKNELGKALRRFDETTLPPV